MKKGFTIIETLVAITILMIAIAGPLVVASKGLTAAIYSKDQMIATFLAQESMEVIKNTRDNNVINNVPNWLEGFGSCIDSYHCDASAVDSLQIYLNCQQIPQSACKIYLNSDGYSHDVGGTQTIFSRYFYLTSVPTLPEEYVVHVVVDWNEGTIPYQIDLVSELVNVRR